MRIRAAQPVPCVEADAERVRDVGGVMCGFGLSIAVWVLDGWIQPSASIVYVVV
jgi:hypothetical protein